MLAAAVYHRMYIYIDFNGMTRMRTIGLLGITSVVGGFLLVLVKINSNRNFLWLIRRQLWVLGTAVFIYAVLPVDTLIHRYNVSQIMSGNLPPVVQITGHEVDNECLPILLPLMNSDDERIAEGIQAFMAERMAVMQRNHSKAEELGWTAYQGSDVASLKALEMRRADWETFDARSDRLAAWQRLQDYAYRNWW